MVEVAAANQAAVRRAAVAAVDLRAVAAARVPAAAIAEMKSKKSRGDLGEFRKRLALVITLVALGSYSYRCFET